MALRFRQQMVPTIITRVIIGRQIRRSLVGCAGRGRWPGDERGSLAGVTHPPRYEPFGRYFADLSSMIFHSASVSLAEPTNLLVNIESDLGRFFTPM